MPVNQLANESRPPDIYEQLLARLSGPHRERLQREIQQTRQPFGAARQHLNQRLAQERAGQLQQRFLALLFAEIGYPEASLGSFSSCSWSGSNSRWSGYGACGASCWVSAPAR